MQPTLRAVVQLQRALHVQSDVRSLHFTSNVRFHLAKEAQHEIGASRPMCLLILAVIGPSWFVQMRRLGSGKVDLFAADPYLADSHKTLASGGEVLDQTMQP
jgi:hypothetical protein